MALADQDDVRSLLSGAGFESIGFTSIEEPVWFGADAEVAYEFVGEIVPLRRIAAVAQATQEGVRPVPAPGARGIGAAVGGMGGLVERGHASPLSSSRRERTHRRWLQRMSVDVDPGTARTSSTAAIHRHEP